jgi:hypothetical protein
VRFGKSDKIEFISTIEGLESIEECLPKSAKHFIPQWFKDIPANSDSTVRVCPSFPDYFSQGYIIPMWCDVKLQSNGDEWKWETSTNLVSWDFHGNSQFLNYKKANFNGVDTQFVFKANCPWQIITPPGWSVLQLPLFYHFNKEWSVMPGVIDTDIHHEINQQVLYHGNGNPILIERGQPFVLYIPFKRSNKLKNNIRYQTKEDVKIFNKNTFNRLSKFIPNNYYRTAQRKRDKSV